MQAGRRNISRSVWRFFEIALFFVISVVGFNFCAKTTNLNSKLKSRSLLQGNGCYAGWLPVNHALCHKPLPHAFPDTRKKSDVGSHALFQAPHLACRNDATPYPVAAFCCTRHSLPQSATALPRNLLQQNPVLLI